MRAWIHSSCGFIAENVRGLWQRENCSILGQGEKMEIYTLTRVGLKLARNIHNPDTIGYRIIHYLDGHSAATVEQIADNCGASKSEALSILGKLRRNRPPIIYECSENKC